MRTRTPLIITATLVAWFALFGMVCHSAELPAAVQTVATPVAHPHPAPAPKPLPPPKPTTIDGPVKVDAYKLIDHTITGTWESAIWDVTPAKADIRTSTDGKTITWVAPPGTYKVEAILVNFSLKRIQKVTTNVVVGTPSPDPNPNPNPNPNPDPQPNPGPAPDPAKLWCVIVEESSQRTPAQASVILSQKLRGEFKSDHFRLADKDVPVSEGLQCYVDRAKGRTLPQLIVADDSGKIWWEGNLPATDDEAVALVQKIKRGG